MMQTLNQKLQERLGKYVKSVSGYNKNILIKSTVNEIKQHISMSITENIKVLPTSYWIPKMYNSPIGTISIIARKQCGINL